MSWVVLGATPSETVSCPNRFADNIRFPGQYYDDETGLHSNRFRYYDPSIGRYISADPIGQFGVLYFQGIWKSELADLIVGTVPRPVGPLGQPATSDGVIVDSLNRIAARTMPEPNPSEFVGIGDAHPRWTPKSGHAWTPEKRP